MKYWSMLLGTQIAWGVMAAICNMPIGHTLLGAFGCMFITIAYDEYHKNQ